jgi:hypothetical protein
MLASRNDGNVLAYFIYLIRQGQAFFNSYPQNNTLIAVEMQDQSSKPDTNSVSEASMDKEAVTPNPPVEEKVHEISAAVRHPTSK